MSVWLWLCSLGFIVWSYITIWKKSVSGQLRVTLRVTDDPLVAGDVVTLTTVLENPSWMPMPLVELWMKLPDGVEANFGDSWNSAVMYSTYLLPKQRVSFQQSLRCSARGFHHFGDLEVKLGDGLGLSTIYEETESHLNLLVRPCPIENTRLRIHCEELLGEQSVIRWYQEDASRLQGTRSYQMGDPYRYLHWAATARTGNLMVKQFETTSETNLYIVPNAQFFENHRTGSVKALLEYHLQVAATLLHVAQEQQYTVGLFTNAAWQGPGILSRSAERGPIHLDMLLSLLGGVTHQAVCSYRDLLMQICENLEHPSSLVLLTDYWNAELDESVRQLIMKRHRILIVTTTKDPELWSGLNPSVSVVFLNEEEDAQS